MPNEKQFRLNSGARFLFLASLFLAQPAFAFEVAYWAWQRDDPPSARDLAELTRAGAHTLYWQIGTLEQTGESWRWTVRFTVPEIPSLEIVPVVRLESRAHAPFSAASLEALRRSLGAAQRHGRLQIDYDCPDRLLADYATALKQIHAVVPKLSVTALPGWIGEKALSEIAQNIDEVLPMFYDFAPDPIGPGAAPEPLIVPAKIKTWLAQWNHYPAPWRVGIPNFVRLTIFDADGKPRGNIREWDWDALTFNNDLQFVRQNNFGVTLFRARAATRVGNTPLREGQLLAVRRPEREALHEFFVEARASSARGLVVFRLPDATAGSGCSLPQLQDLTAVPHLVVRQKKDAAGKLELTNDGRGDLPPFLAPETGLQNRGYLLELEAGKPIFREAEEGDFFRIEGAAEANGTATRVMILLATRLAFSFSSLRAGVTLQTGLIQLAPGTDYGQIRWRILNSPASEWNSLGK